MKVYVASSWRNDTQPSVVSAVRAAGHESYDFKHPPHGDKGFHWSEIDECWKDWDIIQYRHALEHPVACTEFASDWEAMLWADACILVMPCGRSAHIEAGYFVGAKKRLIILLSDGEPELMYKMADYLAEDIEDAIKALK